MTSEDIATQPLSALLEAVRIGDIAMLSTVTENGEIHSRPMETCSISPAGDLFFFSTLDTHLSEELVNEKRVNLNYINAGANEFTSVTGKAKMINNNDDVASHWQEKFSRWVPGGLANPNIVLLKITPSSAEFWSEHSTLKQITRNLLSGEHLPEKEHKVLINE